MENEVLPEKVYGNLKTKWCWTTKSNERIWKCVCLLCGTPCYVKEKALLLYLAQDCGCSSQM